MSDFIKLSCPSCGAKLEITQDINRFACSHCGREHIVKRSGGIVSLSPVVEAINQVKSGVDKTAAELAMARIPKEIAALVDEKNNLLKAHPYPSGLYIPISLIFIVAGLIFVFLSIGVFSNPDTSMNGVWPLLPGLLFITLGIMGIINNDKASINAKKRWEENAGSRIKSLDEQIAVKQSELERNRKLVSE